MTETLYRTVSTLQASTESTRGEGSEWSVIDDGRRYLEASSAATDHDIVNSATVPVKLYAQPRDSVITMGDFGLGAGDNIGLAMQRAWGKFQNVGGTIELPAGRVFSDNRVFGNTNKEIKVKGHGTSTEIYPSNPVDGTFMWDFQHGSVTRLALENFTVIGQVTSGDSSPRENFNGIRVGNSNYLSIKRVQGRFIDGTALKLVRPFNSMVDFHSAICGNSTSGDWAWHITGDPTSGAAANDMEISGATEQDQLGILIEGFNGILRSKGRLKIHGSDVSGRGVRGLQLHRCLDYNLALNVTRASTGDGFIHVSDQGGSVSLIDDHANAPAVSQGVLDIAVLKNFTVNTSSGSDLWGILVVDNRVSSSSFTCTGSLVNVPSAVGGGDYRFVKLVAPGNAGATTNLTRLLPMGADTSKLIVDERDAAGTGTWQYDATENILEEV